MTAHRGPRLGEEAIPSAESALIDALVAIQQEVQQQVDRKRQPVPRGQHPKQHGCVRAELIVDADLPSDLRHGLFREPRTWPALVRFSNARQRNDALPDAHGMAIKVMGVEGPRLLDNEPAARTQDLVLVDHPVFFAKNVVDLVPMMADFGRLMTGSIAARALTLVKGALSPDYRFRILRAMVRKLPDSPLAIQYWSMTPFRWGNGAGKFSLRPQPGTLANAPEPGLSKDKLRRALSAQLQHQEARFDVLVQLQTDPLLMPIEDASAAWDEQLSPYRKVATLTIPSQLFESGPQLAFGENLSFTPWHGIECHRPLGGINRARKLVYEVMSRQRRELNGAPTREPTLAEVDALWPSRGRGSTA